MQAIVDRIIVRRCEDLLMSLLNNLPIAKTQVIVYDEPYTFYFPHQNVDEIFGSEVCS